MSSTTKIVITAHEHTNGNWRYDVELNGLVNEEQLRALKAAARALDERLLNDWQKLVNAEASTIDISGSMGGSGSGGRRPEPGGKTYP